jgi:hypothetical protein
MAGWGFQWAGLNTSIKAGTNRRRIAVRADFPLCSRLDVVVRRSSLPRLPPPALADARSERATVNLSAPFWHSRRVRKACAGKKAGTHLRLQRADSQAKYCPPLAEIVDPVIKPASSEARKTTQRAISSGSPSRPIGICGRIFSFSTFSSIALTISVAM